jgi:hypothetical protein
VLAFERPAGPGVASAEMTGIGSVCGSSSPGTLLPGRAWALAARVLLTRAAPARAGRSQSIPASCHAVADCCHTETGSAGAG